MALTTRLGRGVPLFASSCRLRNSLARSSSVPLSHGAGPSSPSNKANNCSLVTPASASQPHVVATSLNSTAQASSSQVKPSKSASSRTSSDSNLPRPAASRPWKTASAKSLRNSIMACRSSSVSASCPFASFPAWVAARLLALLRAAKEPARGRASGSRSRATTLASAAASNSGSSGMSCTLTWRVPFAPPRPFEAYLLLSVRRRSPSNDLDEVAKS
mmetsp:Transcript_122265/g.353507  ORF Transcript_122265/g.353507 Transcript_122265/m.353507 type:complete len:217 (-) Transcript_122265:600-1250(-)